MTTPKMPDHIVIASYIEPDLVERIRAAVPALAVTYRPDLLSPPRYAADHKGQDRDRTPGQEAEWLALLHTATILFDFDRTHLDDLPEVAPHVRWIQATSAGIGQFVRRLDYAARMPNTVFTTARGVHAIPLAEFVAMCMLMHSRSALHIIEEQRRPHWERYAGTDLAGRNVVIVGLGAVGTEVARFAQAFGMRVVGVKRHPDAAAPNLPVDLLVGPAELTSHLPDADFLVLIAPHTDETEGMIGAAELASLPVGAALINIGRGALVDEPALVSALQSGHLGGAYLDVFAEEPLPTDSPLWSMPNVLVSPHSASTSDRENGRIVDLFCDNLQRYVNAAPLLNVLDTIRLY
ncbi:MAG: D-2-hydroxyacid dehydrogenase [Gemmatimonadetes bacterium]|nr:D-2-hydroxyacid dehydrogenase [Gemmatimonadota bacterium]MDA1102907.1 D-2-hydroxyacid dehydrogenase [Gemmatimonadota bacterium]